MISLARKPEFRIITRDRILSFCNRFQETIFKQMRFYLGELVYILKNPNTDDNFFL